MTISSTFRPSGSFLILASLNALMIIFLVFSVLHTILSISSMNSKPFLKLVSFEIRLNFP